MSDGFCNFNWWLVFIVFSCVLNFVGFIKWVSIEFFGGVFGKSRLLIVDEFLCLGVICIVSWFCSDFFVLVLILFLEILLFILIGLLLEDEVFEFDVLI